MNPTGKTGVNENEISTFTSTHARIINGKSYLHRYQAWRSKGVKCVNRAYAAALLDSGFHFYLPCVVFACVYILSFCFYSSDILFDVNFFVCFVLLFLCAIYPIVSIIVTESNDTMK